MSQKTSLTEKRDQKGFEERLLKAILQELGEDDDGLGQDTTAPLAGDASRSPTPEQRAAFQERLELEVKRIQGQKRQEAMAKKRRVAAIRSGLAKVAMILLFLTAFTGITLYHTDEAFAAGINRFIAKSVLADGAEELRIEGKKDGEAVEWDMADFEGMYFPDWIPRGYALQHVMVTDYERVITYANVEGDTIYYVVSQEACSVVVDDEEVEEERLYVHDSQGKIVTDDRLVQVIWEDSGYLYTVAGNKDLREDLIKMVEQCIRIGEES